MSEIDLLREYFEEELDEKRRTILALNFTGGYSTSIELEPCTLEVAFRWMRTMETDGMMVSVEKHNPSHHVGDLAKDIVFRHPPHTIEYIEIMRRREWQSDD